MFVLINGSFGIGKTTVARELRALLPGSVIYDPEPVGVVLQRICLRPISDFQNLRLWRYLTIAVPRGIAGVRRPVIIPMTFSDIGYLEEIRAGLAASGQPVLHFCLTAPLAVVRQRLRDRGEPMEQSRWAWVHRRAAECCSAHRSAAFATHVAAESRPPSAVAADLAERVTRVRCAC
jgi:predicted kinase